MLWWRFSSPHHLLFFPTSSGLYPVTTETALSLSFPKGLPYYSTSAKQIKQVPFPWATCSKYKQETNYQPRQIPFEQLILGHGFGLIVGLNHRVMPGSSLEQIVPWLPLSLLWNVQTGSLFPLDYEAIWWRLLIWCTNQHLDITHGKSLKVCLCIYKASRSDSNYVLTIGDRGLRLNLKK